MAGSGSRSPTADGRRGRSPSRRPRELRTGERVVERIVEKTAPAGPANYPILTKTNYNEWSLLMKIKLEARSLWEAVNKGAADFQADRMALDAICSAVPADMIATLAVKSTAKEAWDCIKTMRIGDDRVRKSTLQKVRREYELLSFRDGESVEDFAMRLNNLTNQLATLGDPEPSEKIVDKYLRIARPRYKQLVISIETLLDPAELTVEEITGRLRAAEDDVGAGEASEGGKLYLTEEQWLEKYKLKEGSSSSRGGGSSGRGRGGRGSRDGKKSSGGNKGRANDKCHNCGKIGHWARDCRSKAKKEQAKEVTEEESSLLLVEAVPDPQVEAAPAQENPPCLEATGRPDLAQTETVVESDSCLVLDTGITRESRRWIFDTGASNHMTGARDVFCNLDTNIGGVVKFGDVSSVRVEGCGTVIFACKDGEHYALGNVYYIPRLTANIVSCGQLDELGFQIQVQEGYMRIHDENMRLIANIGRGPGRLYVLDANIARPVCLNAVAGEDAWRWHARFGHVNFGALKKMSKQELVRGLPIIDQVNQVCEACLAGKHRRAPFPRQAQRRTTEVLDLVHGDLCGPISPTTPSGKKYFLLLVDDYSRYMWIVLLSAKDEAPDAIRKVQAAAERRSKKKLGALRTDRGGEFTSTQINEYFTTLGVRRELTAPYAPQQNGVVERRNQTIVGAARSMLKAKNLPDTFWGEAVTTAVYILNRTVTKGNGGTTPYQLWTGVTPAVHHLRTFGCVVHVKTTGNVTKLDDRSRPAIFVGYEAGSKAYRVYDPRTQRVRISRDVIFDEEGSWKWDGETSASEFTIDYVTVPHDNVVFVPPASPRCSPEEREAFRTPSPPAAATTEQGGRLASTPSSLLDADHDDAPLRLRAIRDVMEAAAPVNSSEAEQGDDLLLINTDEPTSFEEAQEFECWRKAMFDEMTAIEANGTWELVTPPMNHRPIGLKWVFKTKKDAEGLIIKHKARLVAKGYVQQQGVDFEEVFAPVTRLETVRMLLAYAAHNGWTVHHMDVKSAFLNGDLREDVFVSQPPGFIVEGKEDNVLKLKKALYGLRQAPRAWYAKLDTSLAELGFKRGEAEHAVYTRGHGEQRLIVGVYVDDLIITGGNTEKIVQFKEEMKGKFKMADLGKLSFYLGLEVKQTSAGIAVSQGAYALKILNAAKLGKCNPCHTPMQMRLKLSRNSSGSAINPTEYRKLVGALRYLVNTRPDLAYAVGYVSRFMQEPTTEHLLAVKKVLRYIAGTIHHGCFYKQGDEDLKIVGYSDSDLAGDVDTRRSTTGIMYFLGDNVVSWQSHKQRVVALSSCEAEYIAAATASCQGVWLARLLSEIKGEQVGAVTLKIDNLSAIQLTKNPVFHDRSKHIDTRFHYIRQCVEEGAVLVEPVGTSDQLADILTKSLGRDHFVELRTRIGVRDIEKTNKA